LHDKELVFARPLHPHRMSLHRHRNSKPVSIGLGFGLVPSHKTGFGYIMKHVNREISHLFLLCMFVCLGYGCPLVYGLQHLWVCNLINQGIILRRQSPWEPRVALPLSIYIWGAVKDFVLAGPYFAYWAQLLGLNR
jgi:hypothetical protein